MVRKIARGLILVLTVMNVLSLHSVATGNQGNTTSEVWIDLGPRGGMAQALAISPDFANDGVVLAGEHQTLRHPINQCGFGIRRSTDGGLSWHPTTIAPPDVALDTTLALHDFAFSPAFAADEIVFAATWTGLLRSSDRGQSWSTLAGAPDLFVTSVAVAPDFATSGHVMAGYGYGMAALLYISDDGGQSWSEHHGVSARADIMYSPQFADDGTALAAGDGVFLTTDRGTSWTKVLTSVTFALAASPQFATDATLFAAGVDAVYVSTDGGAAWITHTVTMGAVRIQALAISPAFGTDATLFAGSHQGLYRSTDGGQHWTVVASYAGPDVYAVALAPTWHTTPTLLVGSTAGVYRSDDGGSTWYQGRGIAPLEVTRLVLGPEPLQLTAATARHGVYQSTNGGTTWRFAGLGRPTGISNIALSPAFSHDQTMLAAVPAGAGMGFSRSIDGGATWEWLSSTDYPGGGLAFSPAFPEDPVVFATGQKGKVLRSTDLGETWEPVGSPPTGTYSLSAWHVALPPTYPEEGTLFAGGAGFWRLPQGAETWQPATTGLLTEMQITSLAVSPDYTMDKTLVATAQRIEPDWTMSSGVYRSTDGGVNWTRLIDGLPQTDTPTPLRRVTFSPNYTVDRIIYAQTEVLLYRSTDGGDHWTVIDVPSGMTPLWDVVGGWDGSAYTSGKTGVWHYTTLTPRLYLPLVSR
jgi:photosystem II stability/assembly factor-like uncharacterized protein